MNKKSLQSLLQECLDLKIITRQELVFATCQVARSVVHLADTDKTMLAIEAAERWCLDPSEGNRAAASDASDAAACATSDAAAPAAYAASAAAYAADAAYATATAYAAAAYATAYAAASAAAANADAVVDITTKAQLLLSYLPKVNYWKAWL